MWRKEGAEVPGWGWRDVSASRTAAAWGPLGTESEAGVVKLAFMCPQNGELSEVASPDP